MGAKAKKDMMSASYAKNNFGDLLESARSHPVKIERNGRAVVVSLEDFERMEAMEDAWWGQQVSKNFKYSMFRGIACSARELMICSTSAKTALNLFV